MGLLGSWGEVRDRPTKMFGKRGLWVTLVRLDYRNAAGSHQECGGRAGKWRGGVYEANEQSFGLPGFLAAWVPAVASLRSFTAGY